MKRTRSVPTSVPDSLDLMNDILNQSTAPPPPPQNRTIRVGDMTLRKKVPHPESSPSPSPSPTNSPSPSPESKSGSSSSSSSSPGLQNVHNARRLLEEQLKTGNHVLASMTIQPIPEPKEKKTRKKRTPKYVRSKVPGIDIEEADEGGDDSKKPNASYYKYKLPLGPCARDFKAQMTMDGDDDTESEDPVSKLEEKERCFVCNWSQFTGSGHLADTIREFFDVYKRVKRMPNFAVACNALAQWYMKSVYREDAGMHPMTGRMFFNCMRGAHQETYEIWLRNEIETLKSFNEELREKMRMNNGSVHPDNYRARATNTKMIDTLYGKLTKLLKEEEFTNGALGGGVSGAPFSFSGIQTKGAKAHNRRNTARQSNISDMPDPF